MKFHDIPNTVAKAVASAVRLDVQMLTIHTSGGLEMMQAAEESAQKTSSQAGLNAPLVLGVTVLTSSNSATLAEIGLRHDRQCPSRTAGKSGSQSRPARTRLFPFGDRRFTTDFTGAHQTRNALASAPVPKRPTTRSAL
ncbi:MAG: orotidine 5'-phosphate decarboxylase / HUMPS family protein [Limisphaerales bacterium]